MGNIIRSFVSAFSNAVSDMFRAPVDFLTGKSCSTVCGSTWDLICYIENFCIANLLKMLMVLVLFYIVLLFLYLLYKMGICSCVGRSLCKMTWAFCVTCFSAWEYGCTFLWVKLRRIKRMNEEHIRDIEEEYNSSGYELEDESISYHVPRGIEVRRTLSHRSREHRRLQLQRSLRPRSHRIRVGISRGSAYVSSRNTVKHDRHVRTVQNIKVTRTSKFVQKGTNLRHRDYRRRRW
ncbi:PREDICTED: uncharacterized protein LOC104587554 isoform X1 [Nelumbo nucifera]|uniref:Protein HAPLESS 2-like n=2 Tax=Nelumbo nucifera TaxID=4432 RepID=A0A822Z062_NELNU|nr:PREDICTED: uncharacterized protein LOC104587554 isoform X1 [Nelumbo nucifera]DAD39744.1 TPA_asm: hypothetical protein HUJ06_014067 [Nelumbo nucifera]